MLRRSTRAALTGLIASLVVALLPVSVAAPPLTPQRHALLIGINDYRINDLPESERRGPSFPDLNGARNDVETMRSVMIENFAFPAENVDVLVDGEATREAILKALDDLAQRSRPGDVVYVHFSGHGSQVKDKGGDEADGFDETILPHDARTEGVLDITDDELGRAFDALSESQLLAVLDSCHSGTATRSASIVSRFVPPDVRTWLYEDQPTPKTRGAVETSLGYVLMTGAAESEVALDGPIGGRYFGFFSYLLAGAMQRLPAGSTARQIHEEVLAGYERFGRRYRSIRMPRPQLESPAELMDRPILSPEGPDRTVADASPAARVPFAEVTQAGEEHIVLDDAGFDLGPGALWAIYPAGETSFRPGEATALAETTVVGPPSQAKIVRSSSARVSAGSRAIPLVEGEDRTVLVAFGALRDVFVDALRGEIRRMDDVREANDEELPHFVITENRGALEIRGVGGLNVLSSMSADRTTAAVQHVVRVLRHSRSVAELKSLENLNTEVSFDVALTNPTGTRDTDAAYRIRREGDDRNATNSLQLEFSPESDGYLTIVNIDAEGTVSVLFPNALSEERGFIPHGFVPGGETVEIPDSFEDTNEAGFAWDIAPPEGMDTLQIFFTEDRDTADEIRSFMAQLSKDDAESMSVRGLARRLATRGVKLTATGLGDTPSAPPQDSTEPALSSDWNSRIITFRVEGETP